MQKLVIALTVSILVAGCYTSKKYNYSLTDTNKAIIKNLFEHGRISCTDGYCWQLVREANTSGSYQLTGTRGLLMRIKLNAIGHDEKMQFTVKMKVKNGVLRLRQIESAFLEELGYELFDRNREELIQKNKDLIEQLKESERHIKNTQLND